MKNPGNIAVSEIRNWLENKGYICRNIFVVDVVCIYISSKLSQNDCDEFKNEFDAEMRLKGASFDAFGQNNEFKYYCDHRLLAAFRAYLHDWLNQNNFPVNYSMVTRDISIEVHEELSQSQIQEFEDEFEVKFLNYSLTCNSDKIKYKFS